jgi:hypothetical protein
VDSITYKNRAKRKNGEPYRLPLCVTIREDIIIMADAMELNKSEEVEKALKEVVIKELMKGGFSRELAEEELVREWKRTKAKQLSEMMVNEGH